jgi:SAM-dependent methyltransferase
VGISTRALRDAFPESDTVVGVDTSLEMITMANFLNGHLSFFKPIARLFSNLQKIRFSREDPQGHKRQFCRPVFSVENAERTEFPGQSFDLVTVMYAFHEAPKDGRDRILREAYRVLQPGGTLAVVDICTDYTPSDTMLAGEPYVLEYQKNIHQQLRSMRGFSKVRYETIVPKHVGMWILKRSTLEL